MSTLTLTIENIKTSRVEIGTIKRHVDEKTNYYTFHLKIFGKKIEKSFDNIDEIFVEIKRDLAPLFNEAVSNTYVVRYVRESGNSSYILFNYFGEKNQIKDSKNYDQIEIFEASDYEYMKMTPWRYTPWDYRGSINQRRYFFDDAIRKAATRHKKIVQVNYLFKLLSFIFLAVLVSMSHWYLLYSDATLDSAFKLHTSYKTILLVINWSMFTIALIPTMVPIFIFYEYSKKIKRGFNSDGSSFISKEKNSYRGINWRSIYKFRVKFYMISSLIYILTISLIIVYTAVYSTSAYYYLSEKNSIATTILALQTLTLITMTFAMVFSLQIVSSLIKVKKKVFYDNFSTHEIKSFADWFSDHSRVDKLPRRNNAFFISGHGVKNGFDFLLDANERIQTLYTKDKIKHFKRIKAVENRIYKTSKEVFRSTIDIR